MSMFGRPVANKGQHEKTDMKAVKKLLLFCKPYYPSIIIALILAVVSAITTIIGPDKISDLMNIITSGIASVAGVDMTEFMRIAVILVCL